MEPYINPGIAGAERVFAEALAEGPVSPEQLIELITTDVPGVEPEYNEVRLAYAILIIHHQDLFADDLFEIADSAIPHLVALHTGLDPERDAARLDLAVSRFASRRAPMAMMLNAASADFSYRTPEEGQDVARRQALLLKALLNGELPPDLERLKTA